MTRDQLSWSTSRLKPVANSVLWLLPFVASNSATNKSCLCSESALRPLYSCMTVTVLLHNAHLLEQSELVHISSWWCTVRSILVLVHSEKHIGASVQPGEAVHGKPSHSILHRQAPCKNIPALNIRWQPDINFWPPAAKFLMILALHMWLWLGAAFRAMQTAIC